VPQKCSVIEVMNAKLPFHPGTVHRFDVSFAASCSRMMFGKAFLTL
jgi:hypothetical protein